MSNTIMPDVRSAQELADAAGVDVAVVESGDAAAAYFADLDSSDE